jgi:hypothetical protein
VNVAILDHVLATVTVFDVVPLCEDALYLFVYIVVKLVGIAARYVIVPPLAGAVTAVRLEP